MTEPDPQYEALLHRLESAGGSDLVEQLHDRYLQLARGGVTPGGIPYPSPTDPLSEGADAIRALAEAIAWEKIPGRPSVFPPAAHTHPWGEVTGRPSTFAPSPHTHPWGEVTGRPSLFPPESHTHPWGQVTGRPSTFPPSGHTHPWSQISDRDNIGLHNVAATQGARVRFTTRIEVDNQVYAGGVGRFTGSWNNNITSDRRAVWMDSNGTLGHTASSERYKQDITEWAGLTAAQLAALVPVTFHWKTDPGGREEVGLIAERLDEAGIGWAVSYDDEGRPEAVHYDQLWLALLQPVQRLVAERDQLRAGLAALEQRVAVLEGGR